MVITQVMVEALKYQHLIQKRKCINDTVMKYEQQEGTGTVII